MCPPLAPTHPLVTVFTTRPVIRGERRPGVWYKNVCPRVCRKQTTKMSIPLMEKIDLFSGLGEERRTPWATTRLLDHGSPDIFGAVVYIHRPCPTRSELAVGWFYVEIEGLSSRELFLISVLTIFSVKAQVPPRAAAWTRKKQTYFPRFSHNGGASLPSAELFFE